MQPSARRISSWSCWSRVARKFHEQNLSHFCGRWDFFDEKLNNFKSVFEERGGIEVPQKALQDSAIRVRHQMNVFLNTFRLRTLGFPICNALPHAFDYFGEEVRCAEPFFAVLAALGKTDLFRTHEVPRIKAVLGTLKVF